MNKSKLALFGVSLSTTLLCVSFRDSLFLGTFLILSRWYLIVLFGYIFLTNKKSNYVYLFLCLILFSEWLYSYTNKYKPVETSPSTRETFTVLNHNLLYISEPNKKQLDNIFLLNPDIIVLQELNVKWQDFLDVNLAKHYPYHKTKAQNNAYGIGVYSKYPIIGIEYFCDFIKEPNCQKVTILIKKQKITLYNCHLDSPSVAFYGDGYFFDLLFDNEVRRKKQYQRILIDSKKNKHLNIFCGDLNTMKIEPMFRVITEDWIDAYTQEKPSRSFRTKKLGPTLSLDHFLFRGNSKAIYSEVQEFGNSDHLPIFTKISL